ncbi:hypothetical protein KIN20_022429 [Parelaphostrongylus tenuis]|uniref:Uncharacterized protein n=1 Tax=Parelaphostrongylus tenuis TaxID=148309 RepID=A0AAD5MQM0_PARTN|nr:hypothetical protein KIN20_022429 [Parelaphostrongylus tenuis]
MDMGSLPLRTSKRVYQEDEIVRRVELLEDSVKALSDQNENLTRNKRRTEQIASGNDRKIHGLT